MHLRFSPSFGLFVAMFALGVLPGCVGKGTSGQSGSGVQTVTLSPSSSVSLDLGGTQTFTANARDSNGRSVFATINFLASCTDQQPCAPITIANNGQACAGSWDSLTNPVVCNPGVAGFAQVTATAGGVSSAPTTVYVHQHVQNIRITPVSTPTDPCFSQGVTSNFQATAYSANNVDITTTVGPLNWSSTNANVLTVDSVPGLPKNQVQVTAKTPGITNIFASVSGTTSTPFPYMTCLVKSIKLQVQNDNQNSFTINAGGTKTLVAEAVDTLDVILNKLPLTWSTSNPEVATVSSAGVVTGKQEGGTTNISASCTPPTCNIGVLPGLPIYSSGGQNKQNQNAFGVITAHVLQSKPPTATAWTATTDCDNRFNCASVMFPVTPGNTPIGNGVVVPFTPNGMLFHPAGTRIYLGSSKGLMFVDVTAQNPAVTTVSPATTPCNVAVCGKPLAISADGTKVVVADTETVPNQVYIWDAAKGSSPPVDLLIDGANSAAFSPDQMKLFITTNTGGLFVYSTVDALRQVNVAASANGINFAADGSFAYVAGTPGNAVSGYATCNLKNMGASPALAANPLQIFPLPDITEDILSGDQSVITETLVAVEPPNLQYLRAQYTRNVISNPAQLTCNPPFFEMTAPYTGFTAGASVNLGQGNFTPLFTRVTGDASKVIVVAENIPAVLYFDVASGTTSAFPLTDGAVPRAATATLDGTQIFVAACQTIQEDETGYKRCTSGGAVHIVNTQQGGDIQQVEFTNVNTNNSMCTNLDADHPCTPNLIAVRPQ